jgi:hypothetical protein
MTGALRGLNLALAFILELCALGALAYWGFNASENTVFRLVLGVGAPFVMIVIWGVYLAPKSSRRFTEPPLTGAKLILFGLASVGLAVSGQTRIAAIFMAAAVLNLTSALIWQQH